jgi:hypothetical protein
MADRPDLYYFGRLTITASYEDKRTYILQGLRPNTTRAARGHIWQFVQIEELSNEVGQWVHGFLAKYKPESEATVVVPEAGAFMETEIANLVVARSRFFLHIESGLIAYHPQGSDIRPEQFRERFVELFKDNHSRWFVEAEIQSIDEPYKLREELSRMVAITKVSVSLHPANPNINPNWRRIHERLVRLGVKTYTERYDTKSAQTEGSTIVQDEELLAKLLMAEDGYGTAKVTGRIEGKVKVVSTHDNPITQLAPVDDIPASGVLESLMITIRSIFKRFET